VQGGAGGGPRAGQSALRAVAGFPPSVSKLPTKDAALHGAGARRVADAGRKASAALVSTAVSTGLTALLATGELLSAGAVGYASSAAVSEERVLWNHLGGCFLYVAGSFCAKKNEETEKEASRNGGSMPHVGLHSKYGQLSRLAHSAFCFRL
jgi:hypothetical protein